MIPARFDLTFIQGSTLQRWFALKTPAGTVLDLSAVGDGYDTGSLTVRDTYGGTELLSLTTDNSGLDLTYQADSNGTYWSGLITASATQTANLEDFGDGVFDLEISDGLHVYRIIQGVARLSPEVST